MKLATRYALKENGFPGWFPELVERHVETVSEELRPLIAAELELDKEALDRSRVLQSLSYVEPTLRERLASLVFVELRQHDPTRADILLRALQIVLSAKDLDRKEFGRLARERVRAHHNDRELQLVWFSALLSVDAKAGVDELRSYLQKLAKPEDDKFVLALLNRLYDHGDYTFGKVQADYLSADALEPFLTLVLAHIRREEDNKHEEGSYTPDARDQAERVRGILLEKFTGIPGRGTVDMLLSLGSKPEWAAYKERLLIWSERRAAQDGDLEPWLPEHVAEFDERFIRPIRSRHDLYEVAQDRLTALKYELENDDFTLRDLLRQDARKRAEERPVQLWFAREFERSAHGRYTVHREEEVIDGNEPDIRLASERSDGPTSIEIKVADSWDFPELEAALKAQLVGKYMRAWNSRYGILLLTWHGKRDGWDVGNQRLSFAEVIRRLSDRAVEIKHEDARIDGLTIVGIDLTRPQSVKKGSKARDRSRRAKSASRVKSKQKGSA